MTDEEKQQAWLKKVVEMPFSEWMEYSKDLSKRNPKALKAGAHARLKARGLIDIGTAAGIRWIEPEWFEKGKECGALVAHFYTDFEGKTKKDWIPGYWMIMDDEGNPTYHFEDYENWLREYKSWKAQQPKKYKLEYTEDLAEYAKTILNT